MPFGQIPALDPVCLAADGGNAQQGAGVTLLLAEPVDVFGEGESVVVENFSLRTAANTGLSFGTERGLETTPKPFSRTTGKRNSFLVRSKPEHY